MMTAETPTATRPLLHGPIAVTGQSYPFSSMKAAVKPFDVGDYGYREDEFFVSGVANVYDRDDEDQVIVLDAVPYVNRVLVRRPIASGDASGRVWADIMNASNGFDVEDHWRRAWAHWMSSGDTYIGVTSKPINVDALKNFDSARYARLSWSVDSELSHAQLFAEESSWNPMQELPGTEEGLVWDILSDVGLLLRDPNGSELLGGASPRQVFLIGQSQSSVYLNTWIDAFHESTRRSGGEPLFDGYLASVGAALQRPLRQGTAVAGATGFATLSRPVVDLDVPHITITAEGDIDLFGDANSAGIGIWSLDGPLRRHWQVAGTPHTDLRSSVLPRAADVRAAGRLPRELTPEFLESLDLFPLEPAIIAAMEALYSWVADDTPAPPSVYFEFDKNGHVLRDADGNAIGGLRYGLMTEPIASFSGSADGQVFGVQRLFTRDRVEANYADLASYHDATAAHDADLSARGYLTEDGRRQLRDVGAELWSRVFSS